MRVGTVLILMTLTVGYSEVHHHNAVVRQEMTVNPSGTQVQFSKAKSTLTLDKAVMSKNGDWAFVPFNINNMTYLPNNPSQYRILLQAKGSSHAKLAYKPVVRLVLFGSSGKGAIAIYSATGIQNQPLNIFIINTHPLLNSNTSNGEIQSDTAGGSQTNVGIQALQKKYDMVMFSANPGAQKVVDAKRTVASIYDKETLYMSLFGGRSSQQYLDKISRDQDKIKGAKEMIDEDRSKLTQMGFKVPNDPAWMKDDWKPYDWVNVKTGKTKTGHDAIDYLENNSGTDDSSDDKDNVSYPSTLSGSNGAKMDANGSAQAQQASDLWSDLQSRWDTVHKLKRDIWVTQQTNLYQIKEDKQRQKDQTTIGPTAGNGSISKIRIRTMKLKEN